MELVNSKDSNEAGLVIMAAFSLILVFVLFTSLNWMREYDHNIAERSVMTVRNYYTNMADAEVQKLDEETFLRGTVDNLRSTSIRNACLVIGLFIFALYLFLSNYSIVRKRVEETEMELSITKALAFRDALTGVKSKQAYADITKRINFKIQEGIMNAFAVLVCDLNGLKFVNDTLGHKVGDAYICDASRMICKFYKHSPVFRTGGDEFVVILENDDFEGRKAITESFNRQIEKNVVDGSVVVSAGLSDYVPGKDKNVYDVFVRADALMYERKTLLKKLSKIYGHG